MGTTSPVGICTSCGAGFAAGTLYCTACGTRVQASTDPKVLAERVPATPVYGAPPLGEVVTPDPADEPFLYGAHRPVEDEAPPVERLPLFDRLPVPTPRYVPEFAEPDSLPRQRLSRRGKVAVVALVVLALLLGGLWLRSSLKDRPVRSAFDEASAAYTSVLDALSDADDLAGLQAAGRRAGQVSSTLTVSEGKLSAREGELAEAARGVVRAEREVVAAAAGLVGLTDADLGVWGLAEASLSHARESLTTATNALADLDQGLADAVVDPAKAIDHARGVVGATASDQVNTTVVALVKKLGKVKRTAQIRKIATQAAAGAAVVRAAQAGLSGDSAETVKESGAVFDRLAKLATLDGDHLDVWGAVRVELLAALGAIKGIDAAGTVDHVDTFIGDAAAQLKAWRKELKRAKAQQAKARTELTTYEGLVRGQLTSYETLRASLAGFMTQVDAGQVTNPAPTLAQAAVDRAAVLAVLQSIVTPPEFEPQQQGIENLVTSAFVVMQQSYDLLADNDCYHTCDYPGYAQSDDYTFLRASVNQIATAYTAAVSAFDTAIDAAEKRISDVALPPKPVV